MKRTHYLVSAIQLAVLITAVRPATAVRAPAWLVGITRDGTVYTRPWDGGRAGRQWHRLNQGMFGKEGASRTVGAGRVWLVEDQVARIQEIDIPSGKSRLRPMPELWRMPELWPLQGINDVNGLAAGQHGTLVMADRNGIVRFDSSLRITAKSDLWDRNRVRWISPGSTGAHTRFRSRIRSFDAFWESQDGSNDDPEWWNPPEYPVLFNSNVWLSGGQGALVLGRRLEVRYVLTVPGFRLLTTAASGTDDCLSVWANDYRKTLVCVRTRISTGESRFFRTPRRIPMAGQLWPLTSLYPVSGDKYTGVSILTSGKLKPTAAVGTYAYDQTCWWCTLNTQNGSLSFSPLTPGVDSLIGVGDGSLVVEESDGGHRLIRARTPAGRWLPPISTPADVTEVFICQG